MSLSLMLLLSRQARAYTISTNTTWSSSQATTFTGITIENGATLTITGSGTLIKVSGDIDVKPDSKLIVENNAIVEVGDAILLENATGSATEGAIIETNNHATFTALDTLWNGIQVWGPSFYGLNGAADAILNEATIEKAYIGVATYKWDSISLKTNKGGIIQALGCTFQDNHIGVDLMQNPQYLAQSLNGPIIAAPTNSSSYFKLCSFYFVNSYYIDADAIGLQLTDAKGISVLGCTFKNENSNELGLTGIGGFNSAFRVAPGTASLSWGGYCCIIYTQPSEFINLDAGISSLGPKAFSRVSVTQTQFQNCWTGVSILGSLQSVLTQNDFTVGQWYADPYEIFLQGNSGYTVTSNDIDGGIQADSVYYPFGIFVWNSGADYNEIYKNKISNCNVAIETYGQNRSVGGLTGLELLCNNMHDNNHTASTEILGETDNGNGPQGVAKYQGVILNINPNGPTKLATGNLFASLPGLQAYGGDKIYAVSNTLPFTYGFSSNSLSENPAPVSSNVTPELVDSNRCYTYATSMPFISYTSFLTDIANVESQISAYSVAQQNSSMNPNTSMSQTDSIRLAGLWRTHQQIIDSMLITYMYLDSSEVHIDSVAMALEAVQLGYFNKVKLAGVYLTQLRFDDAINLLNSIPASFNLPNAEATDVQNMKDMYVVIDSLVHNGHNWDSLSVAMRQNVDAVAQVNGSYGTPVARYLQARYEGIFYRPDTSKLLNKSVSLNNLNTYLKSVADKIYPNPATNQLSFNWQSKGKLSLRVFDLSGKEVIHTAIHSGENNLNIQNLASGIYLAEIDENGHVVYQQKFVKK